jgi:hypothetical protein
MLFIPLKALLKSTPYTGALTASTGDKIGVSSVTIGFLFTCCYCTFCCHTYYRYTGAYTCWAGGCLYGLSIKGLVFFFGSAWAANLRG